MAATTNFGWDKPTVGGSAGTWGTELNLLFDDIDTDLDAVKTTADAAMPKAGGVFTGQVEVDTARYDAVNKGNLSGSISFDLSTAGVFFGTVTGNLTAIAFNNWPTSGKSMFVVVELLNGGAFTVTWPSAVKWDGGSAPALQTAGTDVLVFYSRDNGTTIRGVQAISTLS